jgi:hypothetical protein
MTTQKQTTSNPVRLPDPNFVHPELVAPETPSTRTFRYIAAATRLSLGWVFLWAFLDKTFGLGHETASADAWISGGNPTEGFLSHSRKGIGLTICGAKNPRNVSNPDAENDGELLTARLTSGGM